MRHPIASPLTQAIVGCLSLTLALSVGTQAWAQGRQTGTLRGSAHDASDAVLPGVTVTVASQSMQGTRSAVTDMNGNYELPGLANGEYLATFTLDGFTTLETTVTIPLGGTVETNVSMQVGRVAETVQVTAVIPSPLASTEASANVTGEHVSILPVGRSPFRIAELTPGLTANTPNNGQLAINGAFAYDNVFLIDGVDINVVTKSGGNQLSGTIRANLYKPDWTARTPFEIENDNERTGSFKNNTTYETTVGGPVLRDRLWFFYANRVQREEDLETFDETGFEYPDNLNNDRNQIKFTGTIAPGHTLEGRYLRNTTSQSSPSFSFSIDPHTLRDRTLPNDLVVATYRGAVNNNVFAEFQVSRREFGFRGSGGTSTDIIDSPFITLTQALGHYNHPYFDATDPTDRNNRQVTGGLTYYLPTNAGSHSIKAGFEHFQSTLAGGNSQSASGFVFDADYAVAPDGSPLQDGDGFLIPVFAPDDSLIEQWIPVRGATLDINTLSFYVNDNWAVNNNLSVNLGVRAEKVDSAATGNINSIDHSTLVPRLGATYDVRGDGRYTFSSTYSQYAGKYNESQFGQNTNVGTPDLLLGVYTGPPGQGRDFAPGFDPNNYFTVVGDFPVRNIFFDDNLKLPLTKEFTVGGGTTLGQRGYVKITYINRRASNFVEDFIDLDGGSTEIINDSENFGTFTNKNFRNTDLLKRDYDAVEIQSRYQVFDNFMIDGSYTGQINNDGNFEGELSNQPALSSAAFDYPEITPEARYFPYGRLDEFQRHKLRIFDIYNMDLGRFGNVDVGGILRANSGLAYSLRSGGVSANATQRALLTSLGYPDRPSSRTIYYAQGRGSETFDGRGLRPVRQLRHPSVGVAQPVDQGGGLQPAEQRQADLHQRDGPAGHERPGRRARDSDHVHRGLTLRRGDLAGQLPAVHPGTRRTPGVPVGLRPPLVAQPAPATVSKDGEPAAT